MRPFALAILAVTLLPLSAQASPNLLTNGSFESFSGGDTSNGTNYGASLVITGWTRTASPAPGYATTNPSTPIGVAIQATPGTTLYGPVVTQDNATSLSSDAAGGHAAYFVDDQASETLSQTVSLVAGTRYQIGFDYYQVTTGNPNPFTLTAAFGGQTVTAANSATAVPTGTWFNAASDFVANTTGNYDFSFTYVSGAAPADDALVDRVYVQAVPEPMSMVLLGSGLIGTALIRRRQH